MLVEVFARELVEPQRRAGLQILGWFDDVDEPDHFVWLRGYPMRSAEQRAASLTTFYGGPVWRAHRGAANATMIDSDDDGEPRRGAGPAPAAMPMTVRRKGL
jgi:hypothetical protein